MAFSFWKEPRPLRRHFARYELEANYWTRLGNAEAAHVAEERAAGLECQGWYDHYLSGMTLCDVRDYPNAIKHLETAISLRVDDYWTWYFLGFANCRLGHNDRFLWAMKVCTQMHPDELTGLLCCADAHRLIGDTSAAEIDYTSALEQATDKGLRADAYLGLAELYLGSGRLEAALEEINQSVKLIPEGTWFWVVRAGVQQRLGHREQACVDAHQVLTILGSGNEYWHHLHRIMAMKVLEDWQGVTEEAKILAEEEVAPMRRADWEILRGRAPTTTRDRQGN